jgi:ribosomal protein S12
VATHAVRVMMVQVAPLQQAPVTHGFGVQVVPVPPKAPPAAVHAVFVVSLQVLPTQHAPTPQGSGEHELPSPW